MHAVYPPPAELDLCRTPPRSTDNYHVIQPAVIQPEAATSTSQPARRDLLLSANLC